MPTTCCPCLQGVSAQEFLAEFVSERYSLQSLGYFRVQRIPNPVVIGTLKGPHSPTGPLKIETRPRPVASHPREGTPRLLFIRSQLRNGNYYQNRPDSQPLLFSQHVPHRQVRTNTATRILCRHSLPSPAPMHTPLLHLHFCRTTVRQGAWPKGQW